MTWVSRTAVMSLAECGGQVKDAAGSGWALVGCPVPDAQGPSWGQGPAEDGQTSQEVWLGSMGDVCVCVCSGKGTVWIIECANMFGHEVLFAGACSGEAGCVCLIVCECESRSGVPGREQEPVRMALYPCL